MKKNYGKLINDILVRLAWVYMAVMSGIYFYLILDDGLFYTYRHSRIDEAGSFWMIASCVILIWNYPIKSIIRYIKRSWQEAKEIYSEAKKKPSNKRQNVPIITVK